MTTNFWKSVLLWVAASGLLGGTTCLNVGCASNLSLGPSRYSIYSMDWKDIDGANGKTTQRPLWRFAVSTSSVEVDWSWDGVAIAEKAIEDTGRLLKAFIGMVVFPVTP